jgi:hypothetical protein
MNGRFLKMKLLYQDKKNWQVIKIASFQYSIYKDYNDMNVLVFFAINQSNYCHQNIGIQAMHHFY